VLVVAKVPWMRILKPALARGELRAIGAQPWTNIKNILKRQSTRKTFQKIIIEEPDTESAISILRGIKDKYRHTIKYR
jgi:ATP-dependent Clp protease ATP-binding subunit ClpB